MYTVVRFKNTIVSRILKIIYSNNFTLIVKYTKVLFHVGTLFGAQSTYIYAHTQNKVKNKRCYFCKKAYMKATSNIFT